MQLRPQRMLERYASARALTEDTKAAMKEHSDTLMWKLVPDIDHVNAKTSFDAMAKGDALAKQGREQLDGICCLRPCQRSEYL